MNTERSSPEQGSSRLLERALTEKIIGAAFTVRKELRGAYLESVFREAMIVVLEEDGVHCAKEVPIPVIYRGREIGFFRCDLLVEGRVLVELKAGRALDAAHEAQLLNYLSSTHTRVGLLLHFGTRVTFRRFVL